jgi:anti-sigma B factor antagonist
VPRRERPELTVRFAPERPVPVLHVAGELDIGSAPVLRQQLLDLLGDEEVGDVALDLSGVTFLDSSGLAVLLMGARRWDADGNRLIVRTTNSVVDRIIDLTGARAAFSYECDGGEGPKA